MWKRLNEAVFGPVKGDALPARVLKVIERQEIGSERLIGWAQLIVVGIWAALYSVAPKTFSAETTFAPVPIALAAYLGFTILRLALLHRGIAPSWMLALSVVADMSILMGLIWSFHLQYDQPAAFYLKAPTLLYVFIFIALRAMRFDAGYVLLAGGMAAVGWLVLLLYALFTSTEPNMAVTRDYVLYMTSSHILRGAEFDKIIAILLTTTILAVALLRARRLLVASVVEGAAHRDLSRFFSPEIARQITAAESRIRPGEGEIRDAAILICDVRGFTRLAMRTDPNELMRLLADYQRRMVTVIQRHGGSIDKFLGDGIMATFGAALPTDSYAADALRAVQDLGTDVVAWSRERQAHGLEPLRIGFAVAAGPVVFGAVGDASRLEFTVIGEAVNLAAKLEAANKQEGVAALTIRDTLRLAERQGYRAPAIHEARPARPVPGVGAPVDLVVLLPSGRDGYL